MSRSTLASVIIILTLITAGIHLLVSYLDESFRIILSLNALGYLALLWAYLRPPAFLKGSGELVLWAFILFTTVTIVLYFVVNGFKPTDYLGLFDKLVEVLLIVALFMRRGQTA